MIKVFIILLFLFFNKKYASKLKKSDGSCGGLMHTTNMLRINQHHYSYWWKSLREDEINLYFHLIIWRNIVISNLMNNILLCKSNTNFFSHIILKNSLILYSELISFDFTHQKFLISHRVSLCLFEMSFLCLEMFKCCTARPKRESNVELK